LYLRLLHDVDAEVRLHAAHLLVRCHGDDIAQSLRDQLMVETDPVARASILFSIGDLGHTADASVVTPFLSYDDIETRFASAVAIAQLAPEEMPSQAVETLTQVVLDYDQTEGLRATPKNADTEIIYLAAETLTDLGPESAGFVAERILEGLPQLESYCAMEPLEALLGVTIGARQEPVTPDSLTATQRQVLTRILEMPNLWESDYTYSCCQYFGLPIGRKALQSFLREGRPT
jgi:hypothetical protein